MPADNIKRNVDKATGNLDGVQYEEIRYEGYGIGGAAVIVDCMTDNRVRTVAGSVTPSLKHGATWAPKARWPSSSSTWASSFARRASAKTP